MSQRPTRRRKGVIQRPSSRPQGSPLPRVLFPFRASHTCPAGSTVVPSSVIECGSYNTQSDSDRNGNNQHDRFERCVLCGLCAVVRDCGQDSCLLGAYEWSILHGEAHPLQHHSCSLCKRSRGTQGCRDPQITQRRKSISS